MPTKLGSPEYGPDQVVRLVDHWGRIRWKVTRVRIAEVLSGEPVGARCIEDGRWELRYGPIVLGVIDERQGKPRLVAARG